jgi:hypothetical protein
VPIERTGEDITLTLGERSYRVRGLDKNNSFEVLRVNLRLMCRGLYHVNVIDLYQARQRQQFIDDAARETLLDAELIKRDLGKLLLRLEEAQEERINAPLSASTPSAVGGREQEEAMALLRDPHLLDRILADFDACGMTGGAKKGKTIAGHNLVLAPHPLLLERIRAAGQPVDTIMEIAARRALEKLERKIGAKIVAVAATHIQDSDSIRPHLHIRATAYDSLGRYIKLFDRKVGGAGAAGGGGRCLLQPEVERQIVKIIERWNPRERD